MTELHGSYILHKNYNVLFLMRKYKHYATILICYWSCSTTKENINEEKSFCWIKLSFCNRQLPFHCCKFRKAYFAGAFFFAGAYYLFADANREKPILRRHFLAKAKRLNCKGWKCTLEWKKNIRNVNWFENKIQLVKPPPEITGKIPQV